MGTATRMRDAWLDNVKMLLVTMVVIGHAVVLAPPDDTSEHLYDFIYAWHIPAFVLVTGYFSRSFTWCRRHLVALVTTIAVPYVVFELAMWWFRTEVGGEEIGDTVLVNPHWPVWYLAAVFLWRLATPVLARHWVAIPLSVLASLLFPLEGSTVLDLNRVIGLLPFFVLGLHLTPELLAKVRSRSAILPGAVLLVALWQVADHFDELIPHPAESSATTWFWYSEPYAAFGVSGSEGMVVRLCLIAVTTVAILAVMALVPRGHSRWSDLGTATLVVYLLHGFVVRGAEYAGYAEWADAQGGWTLWLTIAWAIALSLLLAAPPVARRLNHVVDPLASLRERGDSRSPELPENAEDPSRMAGASRG